jgi:hypothetical protein
MIIPYHGIGENMDCNLPAANEGFQPQMAWSSNPRPKGC